jgi:pimeloyl-ACP methyl ester carboxylesterase
LDATAASQVSSYTHVEQCRDLDALIIALHNGDTNKRAILMGHDWGGAVVWTMARRFPHRIAAIASFCTMYVSVQEVSTRFPIMHYQHYFGTQHRTAANELQHDLSRTFRVLMRSYVLSSLSHCLHSHFSSNV